MSKDVALYEAVDALGEVSDEWTVPNTEVWEIQHFAGNGAFLDDAHVCLIWDYEGAGETIIRATHGDTSQGLAHQVTGDGTKKLALVLLNDTEASRVLGATYRARQVS